MKWRRQLAKKALPAGVPVGTGWALEAGVGVTLALAEGVRVAKPLEEGVGVRVMGTRVVPVAGRVSVGAAAVSVEDAAVSVEVLCAPSPLPGVWVSAAP